MTLSLYQRLTLSLVLVFVLMCSIVVWFSGQLQKQTQLESEQRLHLGLAGHLVSDNPLLAQGAYDYASLQKLFHTLMMLGPSFEFYYVDTNGKILTYSAEPGKVKRTHVDVAPVQQLIQGNVALPVLGDDPRNLDKQKIFSAAPVYKDDELQGYLYMIIGGEIYDSVVASVQNNQSLKTYAGVVFASLIFLLVVLIALFKAFTKPLSELTHRMKTMSGGTVVEQYDDNEVSLLTNVFDQLIEKVQMQVRQLENIDEQRRVLLADLSHDLRTPLASLQGYIETLAIKGDDLPFEERQRFIDISHKNARNLKRLIDQVFELAYLEGGQVTLNQESFPVGELLYDVVAKFELKAKDKNITLNVSPSELETIVIADIGKLERVLTNLIENAIRHTPEGGDISLVASQIKDGGKQQIRIDVADTGVGISQNELAFIFDARYRATNTQEDRSTHAGLGLAISKKLMNLLNSDLTVRSEVGKGTCFSFALMVGG